MTTYEVTLTNDLDPLSDSSGDTVVTVELKGPNGEKTVTSVPIYLSISSE